MMSLHSIRHHVMLSLLALVLFSCSDALTEPEGNGAGNTANETEALYFSLDVTALGDPGTRAHTETDYWDEMKQEDGQGYENGINTVKVILVSESDKVLATFSASSTEVTGSSSPYTAKFKKDYNELQYLFNAASSSDEIKAKVYVVCNAPDSYELPEDGAEDWQKTFDVDSKNDIANYGSKTTGNFLMSNGDYASYESEEVRDWVTIKISELKKHTNENNPYPLSAIGDSDAKPLVVPVQRALARFDIGGEWKDFVYYFDENGFMLESSGSEVPAGTKVTVTIKYMGIGNINKKFNLFKKTGNPAPNEEWKYFQAEPGKYVFDPAYEGKIAALSANSAELDRMNGYYINPIKSGEWLRPENFTNLEKLIKEENPLKDQQFRIVDYCVPNTIHEAEMQKNGITTVIVFAARFNFTGGLGEGTTLPSQVTSVEEDKSKYIETPIYMWGGKFYGTNRALLEAVNAKANSKDLYMADAYQRALQEFVGTSTGVKTWENPITHKHYTDAELLTVGKDNENVPEEQKKANLDLRYEAYNALPMANFAKALTANGFAIFTPINFTDKDNPDAYEYGCLYYYWNRHNDNNDPDVMGQMEFGVVRNNIYKLTLKGLSGYGHPIPREDVETDPDPLDPWTDDEVPLNYLQINAEVKNWGLRVDDDIELY